MLLERCRQIPDFSDDPQSPLTPAIQQGFKIAGFYVMRNALAFHLTRKSHYYHEALRGLIELAGAYARRPLTGHDCRAVGGGMYEQEFVSWLACAYDLLAAEGFGDAALRVLNAGLQAGIEVVEANRHCSCSNHNSWGFRANLSIAGALGDRQRLFATLYGGQEKDHRWRYGFIHQLRHDLLADGIEWEHNLRHHFLTMATYADLADRGRNLGIDLWNRTFPASLKNEGSDLHRDYGPPGDKALWTAFVSPLYQIFPNGEFPLLGDSRLSRIQGLRYWGIFYHLAYEAHPDPRLAWAIHQIELRSHARSYPDLPAGLQTETADLDFVRLLLDEWPAGRFDLKEDSSFGLTGLNRKGCSLFPAHGSALLRADPDQFEMPCAFLFWGPHSGGHQGPGALNLELYAGHRITDAPWSRSFEDPLHLAWCRTTLAHNTVTVDETPMHPYDQPTESVWESDYWHHTVTDGELLGFYPDGDFKIVRACNGRVYPGVRLDRTVVVGRDYVLDLYRCLSPDDHRYDWGFQCPAEIHPPHGIPHKGVDPFTGDGRGYSQLRNLQGYDLPTSNGIELKWTDASSEFWTHSTATAEGDVVTALTPEPDSENGFPGSDHQPSQACSILLIRCRGRSVAFATLFTFGPRNYFQLGSLVGDADGDLTLTLKSCNGEGQNWLFPIKPLKPHWKA